MFGTLCRFLAYPRLRHRCAPQTLPALHDLLWVRTGVLIPHSCALSLQGPRRCCATMCVRMNSCALCSALCTTRYDAEPHCGPLQLHPCHLQAASRANNMLTWRKANTGQL